MDTHRRTSRVSLRASPTRPLAAVTLFFAFLLGLAGEAYGLHHDHAEAPGPSASASGAGHGHDEGRMSDSESDEAPCTCLGICHGASASPLPSAPPAATHRSADPVATSWPADDPGPLRAPTPYLLPFANGPPAG